MNCPACGTIGAYQGFNSVECRNPTCDRYTEAQSKVCPVCGGLSTCPGFEPVDYGIREYRHKVELLPDPRYEGVDSGLSLRGNPIIWDGPSSLSFALEVHNSYGGVPFHTRAVINESGGYNFASDTTKGIGLMRGEWYEVPQSSVEDYNKAVLQYQSRRAANASNVRS